MKKSLKGKRYCDFLELLKFIALLKKPATIYSLYHRSNWRGDTKKIYRYLRYSEKLGLIKLDHVDTTYFLHAKFYSLTPAGETLLKWGNQHLQNLQMPFKNS